MKFGLAPYLSSLVHAAACILVIAFLMGPRQTDGKKEAAEIC